MTQNVPDVKQDVAEEEIVITFVDEEDDSDDITDYQVLTNKNILIETNPNIILEPVEEAKVIPKSLRSKREDIEKSVEAILAKERVKAAARRRRISANQRKAESELALCPICGKMVRLRYISKHMACHGNHKCDICSTCFKTEEELDKHREVHLDNDYPCEDCELSFKTAMDFSVHNYQHVNTFQCPLCKFCTKSKSSICGHIKRHEGQYNYHCTICGKGFIGRALLATHEEIHLDIKQYTCDLCGKKFSVRRYLDVHRQLNHKKELYGIEELFRCDVCGREFTFEKSLRRHQSVIHQIGEDRTVQCKVCDKVIANNYNLKMHMRIHTGEKNYCCDKCGKAFSAYKYWKKHKVTHERKQSSKRHLEVLEFELEDIKTESPEELLDLLEYEEMLMVRKIREIKKGSSPKLKKIKRYVPKQKPNQRARSWMCKICFEEFESRKDLFNHRKSIHEDTDDIVTREEAQKFIYDDVHDFYTCNNCSAEFQTKEEVEKHYETHEEKYECQSCNKTISGALNFSSHMQQHREDKHFPCPLCNHITSRKSAMLIHIVRLHFRKYDFQCRSCGKCFNDASTFKEHENIHLGLKPFICIVCSKEFVYSRYLVAHQVRNHRVRVLDKDSKTQCHMCSKIFARSETLVKHMLNKHLTYHGGPAEKKHLCDVCGQGFSRTDKLKIHYRKHTGEKPFSCIYCSKSFIKKDYLIMHERIHNGEKPYVCEVCGKSFNQGAPLRIHMRSHTGERPYVCPHCNTGCISKGALNAHIKSCLNSFQ